MTKKIDWSLSVGSGWKHIVDNAVSEIQTLGGEILQVKEKFGGLRIYVANENPQHEKEIDTIISEAEIKASVTCEECGKPGTSDYNDVWLKTLCKEHADERKKKIKS